ncbi:MAG: SIMPL domain-containing protein [Rhodobacteraceae bacterium]|nr:SIMPL domain-containing protein [Paracoccaceae bacterium]
MAAGPDDRVINVTGQGKVEMVPDMAEITLGVTHEAKQAAEAMQAVSEDVARILAQLAARGVATRDVQTQGLSLEPVWRDRQPNATQAPRITGFVARNTLSVRVRALDSLGAILDAAVSDGANDLRGLRFGLQDPETPMAQARAEAVRDAMARAALLAEAAGVGLGPVVSISDMGGGGRPMMAAEMMMARGAGVPVAAGEVAVAAQVAMVFAIVD